MTYRRQIVSLTRQVAMAAGILVWSASAKDLEKVPVIVTRNCSGCHGLAGNSQLPDFPRLAGLQKDYLSRQILRYKDAEAPPVNDAFIRIIKRKATSKTDITTPTAKVNMIGIAHSISEDDLKAAAEWYTARLPALNKGGKSKGGAEGEKLFRGGSQAQGLPACRTCHGDGATGTAIAPRLAGQNSPYLIAQLIGFRSGERPGSPQMTKIAQALRPEQMKAVAVYLMSR